MSINEIKKNYISKSFSMAFSEREKQNMYEKLTNYYHNKITLEFIEQALGKFIARVLIGKYSDIYIEKDEYLLSKLTRSEYWPKEIRDEMERLKKDIYDLDELFGVKVKHTISFYELLKEYKDIMQQNYS